MINRLTYVRLRSYIVRSVEVPRVNGRSDSGLVGRGRDMREARQVGQQCLARCNSGKSRGTITYFFLFTGDLWNLMLRGTHTHTRNTLDDKRPNIFMATCDKKVASVQSRSAEVE